MRSHTTFGPDWLSRFDVFWIQTDRQTNKHQDKPNLYIDSFEKDNFAEMGQVLEVISPDLEMINVDLIHQ